MNAVILGNCAEVMAAFPESSIDLTVTSPPYGSLRDYTGFGFNFPEVAKQLYRVTKSGGVLVWIVGDQTLNRSESGESFRNALGFVSEGFNLHDTMIYLKPGVSQPSPPNHKRYHQSFEFMFVMSKGVPKTFNPICDVETLNEPVTKVSSKRRIDGSMGVKNRYADNQIRGKRTNVWKFSSSTDHDEFAHMHPAPFPQSLARDHILTWSNEGDTVLDVFAGSGTTLKMAAFAGRKFIGIECSREYCENIIVKRVANWPFKFIDMKKVL